MARKSTTNEVNTRDHIGRGKKTVKAHHAGKLPKTAPKMKTMQRKGSR